MYERPENCEYFIFLTTFSFGVLIAIGFNLFGQKTLTPSGYFFGDKNMNGIAIGISIVVSHLFGAILTVPVEVYKYGSNILFANISAILVAFVAIFVYLPVFFKLQLTNVYEYFSKRFDRRMKYFTISLYLIAEAINFSYTIYFYASINLPYEQQTDKNIYLVYFGLCAFCVFYTAIGGLKAIVWTDICYFILIIVSLIAICSISLLTSGGFSREKIVFNFEMNPLRRDGFWNVVLGYTATRISRIVVHQTGVQKYLCLPRFRSCIWSVLCGAFCQCTVMTLCVLLGLIMYTNYEQLEVSKKSSEHLLIKYGEFFAGDYPALRALLAASIFADALSSMSSLIHSLSCVVYETWKMTQVKLVVVICGVVCSFLIFLINYSLTISLALRDSISGALLGMFTLGMLFPSTNSLGAFYGGFTGLGLIFVNIMIVKYYEYYKFFNPPMKQSGWHSQENKYPNKTYDFDFVKISFYYYTLIGALATIISGVILSYLFLNENEKPVDKSLISPVCHFLLSSKCEENNSFCDTIEEGSQLCARENVDPPSNDLTTWQNVPSASFVKS